MKLRIRTLKKTFLQLALQRMRILLLDNYDSFTYNLLHLLEQFDGIFTEVIRNDEITPAEAGSYDRILLSPGPGLPCNAGVMNEIIRMHGTKIPMLGICLGMQAMADAFGKKLINVPRVFHGVECETFITDENEQLFQGIQSPFLAGRYHSWCVDKSDLGDFKITAVDAENNVMGMTHQNKILRGLQFHPESVMTDCGKRIISNWLSYC